MSHRRPRPTSVLLPALALLVLPASSCSKDADVRPDPGGTGMAGSAGAKPAPTSCRQDRPGPPMVLVPKPGGAFCIDSRETSRGEYAAFLNAAGELPTTSDAACKANLSYFPTRTERKPPLPDAGPPSPDCYDNIWAREPQAPQATLSCVDWCDARDFCAWAGKRLCSAAPEGTTREQAGMAGEWNLACSNGGKTVYPYGNTYEPGRCWDKVASKGEAGTTPYVSGNISECVGEAAPYDELFDMSGGLWEWTSEPHGTGFVMLGGAFNDVASSGDPTGGALGCWKGLPQSDLNHAGPAQGIRCCADD